METAHACPPPILAAIAAARSSLAGDALTGQSLDRAAEAAEIVGSLTGDEALALAVLGERALAAGSAPEPLADAIGARAAGAAAELQRLMTLEFGRARPAGRNDTARAEALRKMLVAVVSDPRLVVARLAIELTRLRAAKRQPAAERKDLAETTRTIFAPLANRLGVWQLKWELEDLAFRYLEPEEYQRIAGALAEKRVDRERYIVDLCRELEAELRRIGVQAEVFGRPKHIHSIYRKMQRKHLAFDEVFDVRAVRIVVASIPDCYAALGVVHNRWRYVPGEFDDYIATPKDNFYRSIHTAVIGPEGKSVEVQIRTREMHEHSELGVAAHWRYKEGGGGNADYERKIQWVRRLLEPSDRGAEQDADFVEQVRAELFEDRVYALTPKGEVIDLPRGATPLDFAYQVHTDLGHRCRGAKVNGRIVPLGYRLANGEVVEVVTQKTAAPSRDWLSPDANLLASPRSRAKVRAWFRRQDETENRTAGREIVERELARLGGAERLAAVVQELKATDADQFYRLVGEGEISASQIAQAAERIHLRRKPAPITALPRRRGAKRSGVLPVEIEGVDDLPLTLARCCAPVRPQPIAGYVTLGRGVTVHRADCPGLARMRAAHAERALAARWTDDETSLLAVELTVSAWDRRGLVRDLSDVLASERLSIDAMSTTTQHGAGTARTVLRFGVPHLDSLGRLLRRLRAVPSVTAVRRSG